MSEHAYVIKVFLSGFIQEAADVQNNYPRFVSLVAIILI